MAQQTNLNTEQAPETKQAPFSSDDDGATDNASTSLDAEANRADISSDDDGAKEPQRDADAPIGEAGTGGSSDATSGDGAEKSSDTVDPPPAEQSEEEIEREEAILDALDATPENRRRSAVILSIVAFLFVGIVAIIIIHPPMSKDVEKSDAHIYRVMTEDVVSSAQTGDPIAYSPIESSQTYRMSLEQKAIYADGVQTRIVLDSDVILDKPQRSVDLGVTIQLADVSADVFDGDEHVKLASPGRMLAGVSLYARLLPQTGLSSVVPDANINPQVARVLFTVADVLHYAWLPLSSHISTDAEWTFSDKAELVSESAYRRHFSVSVRRWDSASQRAELVASLGFAPDAPLDDGRIDLVIERGRLVSARGAVKRLPQKDAGGAREYDVKFEIFLKDNK